MSKTDEKMNNYVVFAEFVIRQFKPLVETPELGSQKS